MWTYKCSKFIAAPELDLFMTVALHHITVPGIKTSLNDQNASKAVIFVFKNWDWSVAADMCL